MYFHEELVIETSDKKPILADVSFYDTMYGKPLVVFCHGYKGFKDWGCWNLVAEKFAQEGFTFLKFNFSHNGGTIDNPIDFPDPDAFGKNTYSLELEDVKRVLDFAQYNWTLEDISIIGHSRGGGISLLAAAQDPRIKRIATWASVSDYRSRFPAGNELLKWKEDGVRHIENTRTGQLLPHFFSFYEDFIANEEKLDILENAKKISVPCLIIHGTKDEAVSIDEAHLLKEMIPQAQEFYPEADHTFDAKHPWEETILPLKMETVLMETIHFFKN